MKIVLPIFLVIIVIVLGAALYFTKAGDTTQITTLNTSLTDSSNRLDIVTAEVTVRDTQLYTLSNSLVTAGVAITEVSNQLAQAQGAVEEQKRQVSKLNSQVTDLNAQNDALNHGLMDLTNQLVSANQLQESTQASLEKTNNLLVQVQADYSVLGQRLQENVAQRLVVERKFRNPQALQDELDFLKNSPEEVITPERIYAGLNVLVSSNGTVRVLSPD